MRILPFDYMLKSALFLSHSGQNIFGNLGIVINLLNIVMILQRFNKRQKLFGSFFVGNISLDHRFPVQTGS